MRNYSASYPCMEFRGIVGLPYTEMQARSFWTRGKAG